MTMRTHMLHTRLGIAALSLFFGLTAAHAQQMYRWVDKNGRVTYSQNPPPAGAAKSVEQRRMTGGGSDTANLPYATVMAAQNFPVTLYTSAECGEPCKNGRDMLSQRGIPFKETVTSDPEVLRKATGEARVPTLMVGRQSLLGFQAAAWKSALDDAGYPASIPAFARAQAAANVQRNLPAVKLYVTADCGVPCQNAKDLLAGRKIPFQETVVESEESREELQKVAGTVDAVPVLLVGGSTLTGFNPDRYNSVLSNAGFQQAAAVKK